MTVTRITAVIFLGLVLAGCSGGRGSGLGSGGLGSGSIGSGSIGSGGSAAGTSESEVQSPQAEESGDTIWDLFKNRDDPNVTVRVNRYLWNASLDILNFLPVEAADPFTGVIVTGYGRPPGGGRAYRATIHVSDPALDARSLNISLQTSGGGAVDPDTVRAVEDAILTRARQLRIQDGNL